MFRAVLLLSKTLSLKQVFQKALLNLNVDSKDVKTYQDKNIAAITLTGSALLSFKLQLLGQNLKETVMELGGSDAYIILDDVDLEKQPA
jgi:succinate-semialdehyde dehydrogenase/glutarate-semialdehyde dehydrogenase